MKNEKKVENKTEKIVELKIEKTLELVCQLYNNNIITDVYIVGSVAEGTANQYSDIDINLINPMFEINPNLSMIDLKPDIENSPNIKKLADILKYLGAEFRYIERKKGFSFWYQYYKRELFHIMLAKDPKYIVNTPKFQITKEVCQWFI